jgi:hypothetical protein
MPAIGAPLPQPTRSDSGTRLRGDLSPLRARARRVLHRLIWCPLRPRNHDGLIHIRLYAAPRCGPEEAHNHVVARVASQS